MSTTGQLTIQMGRQGNDWISDFKEVTEGAIWQHKWLHRSQFMWRCLLRQGSSVCGPAIRIGTTVLYLVMQIRNLNGGQYLASLRLRWPAPKWNRHSVVNIDLCAHIDILLGRTGRTKWCRYSVKRWGIGSLYWQHGDRIRFQVCFHTDLFSYLFWSAKRIFRSFGRRLRGYTCPSTQWSITTGENVFSVAQSSKHVNHQTAPE